MFDVGIKKFYTVKKQELNFHQNFTDLNKVYLDKRITRRANTKKKAFALLKKLNENLIR